MLAFAGFQTIAVTDNMVKGNKSDNRRCNKGESAYFDIG